MAKKLLAFLLTFALILSTVATVAILPSSAADVSVWDGETVATAFAGGDGTKANPYKISNGAQLAYLVNSVATVGGNDTQGKYYVLTADIYLNDVQNPDWKENAPNMWLTTKGDNNYRFRGNFDGKGHTVYGMYYSGTSGYVGLLPTLDTYNNDVEIKNITVSDSYISTSGSIIGVISPRLYSDNKKTAHFYNINIKDSVKIESTTADAYVGGILGFSNCNENSFYQFSGCSVLADISSDHALIGYGTNKTVANIIQSYTTAADWYPTNNKATDTAYLISDIETVKGVTAAKEVMPGLDWLRIWACSTEGYPYAMNYNTNNVVGRPWSGLWAANYAGGAGTAEDPYIIETAEQLAKMVRIDYAKNGYFKITKDIYLNDVSDENWKTNSPKSWYDRTANNKVAFVGNIDGTGHTVHGIYYNSNEMASLVPYAKDTTISNLRISNSDIKSTSSSVAAFISFGEGTITFKNCAVDETVSVESGTGSASGYVAYGTLTLKVDNCSFTGNLKIGSDSGKIGAFCANLWNNTRTIKNSFAVGYQFAGNHLANATNCYNTVPERTTADGYGAPTVLESAELMQGADALNNMPLLTGFGTTDTYPTIYQQGTVGTVWTGSVAADYANGSGTQADPYIIETAEQLVKLVKDPNTSGKYYEITADIKLNDTSVDNWQANAKQWFGFDSNSDFYGAFSGTLNGNGNAISGLYYNGGNYYVGLFGKMSGATIKNVIISDSSLISSHTGGSVSAFTGYVAGSINYSECVVDDTVTISGAHASGYGSYGSGNVTIDSCTALAEVSGTKYGGAFLADIWTSTLKISNSIGIGTFSPRRAYSGSNNYGTVADSYGVNVVTVDQMQGTDALTNMPLLTGYYATDSYPSRYTDGLEGSVWSGGIASSFTSGIGTQADPYIITTGEQLARIFTIYTKGYYFALGNDIVLGNDETANNWFDSSNTKVFEGTLDGNNHIVSGLTYDKTVTTTTYAGLIPKVSGGTVKNVVLEDSSIKMTTDYADATYVGGIVGYNTGKATIFNCYVAEDVALSNKVAEGITSVKTVVGGILGGGQAAFEIDGCAFLGTLEYSPYRYGAVFGDVWSGTVNDKVVKNTFADNCTFSTRWGFTGSNNVSTVALGDMDGKNTVKVVSTLKGEAGLKNIEVLNRHGRYFGTESYPMVCAVNTRFEDANGDRVSNALDLTLLRNKFIGNTTLGNGDVNGDGYADARDIVYLKKQQAEKKNNSDYELVWFDEFSGDTLDSTKWNTAQTRMSDTNELAQSNAGYVRSVTDGNLQLSAIKNPYYKADGTYFEQHKYTTTTSVTTENKMSFKYGYVEIRAKVPYKEGCWPSFWLRSHNATGKLSNPKFEVEVDVFEVFGNNTTMTSNLHQQNYDGKSYQTGGGLFDLNEINEEEKYTFDNAENLSNEYHTYGFEWEPDRMAIYVDGVKQCEWELDALTLWLRYGMKANTSGFNTTMNILFNNHLFTENSTYKPSDENIIENHEGNLPAEFDIDYVRLYQKNDGKSVLILGE